MLERAQTLGSKFEYPPSWLRVAVLIIHFPDETGALEGPQRLIHLADVEMPERPDTLVEATLEAIPVI